MKIDQLDICGNRCIQRKYCRSHYYSGENKFWNETAGQKVYEQLV